MMETWNPKPDDPSRYDKRLAIIVPYRNRPQHLQIFVPHIMAYFRHEKLDRRIAMSLHVVEQTFTGNSSDVIFWFPDV